MAEILSAPRRRNRVEVHFNNEEFLRLRVLAARAGASTPGAFVKQSALATVTSPRGNPFALSWVPEYVLRIQQIALNLQAIASNSDQDSQTIEALRKIEAELTAHRDYFFRHSGPDGGQPA